MTKQVQRRPSVDDVLAPVRRRFARLAAMVGAIALSLTALGFASGMGGGVAFVLSSVAFAMLGFLVQGKQHSRLKGARALMAAGHFEEALVYLKRLARSRNKSKRPRRYREEASYLVACCYERQGAHKLAKAYYGEYLERYPTGSWRVEAQLKLEELAQPSPAIGARLKDNLELCCPFCKDGFREPAAVRECAGCGTPQHEACYAEHGGCSLLGCRAAPAARQRA